MLRASHTWDVRCPPALPRMFPVRRGYYYKVTRAQGKRILALLCRAYGIPAGTVTLASVGPTERCNGQCWYLPGRKARIHTHARAHMKTVFHEFYHALDHYTGGLYNSDDRRGGDTSLAWQFADRLFDIVRHTKE